MKFYRLLLSVALASSLFTQCKSAERNFAGSGGGPGTGGSVGAEGGANGESGAGAAAGDAAGGASAGADGIGGAGGDGGETCSGDGRRCHDGVPETCGPEGAWQATQTGCAFGCLDGACNACEEDAKICEGGQAKFCKGGQWQYTPCESQCEDGACVEVCTEGARQCDGLAKVQICRDGAFVDEEVCDGVCTLGACVGVCKPDAARCTPGAAAEPELCSAQGEWLSAPCQGTANVCLDGVCVVCSPGAVQCSASGRPQTCSEFGSWADEPPCPTATPQCVGGACQLCEPGARRCNVGRPQQCNTQGSAWVDGAACGGATPACVATTGQCGTCLEGDVQCGSATTPQTCDASGKWVNAAACAGTTPACVAGECAPCAPNTTRCVGAAPQLCSGDGQWVTQAACSGTTPVCLPATGQCGCSQGALDCEDGNTPRSCSAAGTWVPQADCRGDTPVCSKGACVCVEGAQECTSSSTPRECTDGAWKSSVCPTATPVCFNGNCGVCSPGATRCSADGTQLVESCTPDGVWMRGETCTGVCRQGACVNVPCSEEPLLSGVYNFRCSAAAGTFPAGSSLPLGDYLMARWSGTGCLGYGLGATTLFTHQGNTFQRYVTISRVATSDPGVKTSGTFWLQTDTQGNVTRTEMCDPLRRGVITKGTYQQVAATPSAPAMLYFTFTGHQEGWSFSK